LIADLVLIAIPLRVREIHDLRSFSLVRVAEEP
jgi:hypothetical protein